MENTLENEIGERGLAFRRKYAYYGALMLFIKTPRDNKMLTVAHLQVWMLLKVYREFKVKATGRGRHLRK